MICKHCSKETNRLMVGYCGTCYARYRRNGTPEYAQINKRLGIRKCSFCSSENGPFVKALCKPCYYRDKKNGTLEYQKVPKFCTVPGCEDVAVAHGFCDRHRKRIERNGNLESKRPPDWGAKSKHPMWEAWKSMLRLARASGGVDVSWNDFWKFIDDVGERPSPKHRLYRINDSQPYQPGNVEWRSPLLGITPSDRQALAAYQRAYRLRYPDRARDSNLRKMYGVSLEKFNEMLEAQNHACAICKKTEGSIDPYNKKPRKLAVDHCHSTNNVRGLLCSRCNTALGGFGDDPETLRSAIAYLEKSKA